MNLQPLYDLKDRLQHAAVAGTGLIAEDFRLHRAIEGLEPLASANPVFGKISQAARLLLCCTEEERPGKLLDILSLVDAVVYTQGVVNIPGELMVLEPGVGHYCQIPHSILSPLKAALSSSGSGRTSLIRETWMKNPEFFRDFRVLPLAVQALGDSYAELSELMEEILTAIGPEVIPMLKHGFDPQGKTPMAKRVRLIAKLAGEGENDWYLEILPNAQKEVRIALIQALALSRDNADLLLSLCQTEKGKVREAALHAAAKLHHPDIEALWRKELAKKPGLLQLLTGVDTPFAAELAGNAARALWESLLDQKTYPAQIRASLDIACYCLVGKSAPEVRDFWLWVAANMERFATVTPEELAMGDFTLADLLQSYAMECALGTEAPEMLDTFRELGTIAPKHLLCCSVSVDMRTMAPDAFFDQYSPMLKANNLLGRISKEDQNRNLQILQAFTPISWSEERGSYLFARAIREPLADKQLWVYEVLPDLDPRWAVLLCSGKISLEGRLLELGTWRVRSDPREIIPKLLRPDNETVCNAVGSWMYQCMMDSGNLNFFFYPLLKAGWKNWTGVLAHCARKKGQVHFDQCLMVVKYAPMTNREKAAELRAVYDLAENPKASIRPYFWPKETILQLIAQLEADENYKF